MDTSIRRMERSPAVTHLAIITKGVEYAFVAAGVTVAAIAGFQSLTTVVNWLAAGG